MYADRDVIFALLELGQPPPMEAGRDAVQAYFERLAGGAFSPLTADPDDAMPTRSLP